MTFTRKWALAAALAASAGVANAGEFSSTITAASEYDFRGFSQSAKDPALQASADYDFGNGFAVGAWASNIDFEPYDGDIEVDLYLSYSGEINENTSWSAGFVYYMYPDSSTVTIRDEEGEIVEELSEIGEYAEYYVGLDVGPIGLKQWYSDDLYESGEDAFYTELNTSIPLPANFSVLLHAGYSWGGYWDEPGVGRVFDYAVGLGYDFSNFSLALKYLGTDASGEQKITDDVANNEGRVVFTISTTLPWGE